jgi:hypothetical protein
MKSRLFWTCAKSYSYLDSTFCGIAERLTSAGFGVKVRRDGRAVAFSSTEFGQHTILPTTLSGQFSPETLTPLAALLLIGGYTRPESAVLLAHSNGTPMSRTALRSTLDLHIQTVDRTKQATLYAITGQLSLTELTTIFRDELFPRDSQKRRVTF